MARKTVTPGHVVEDESAAVGTALDDMQEGDGVYAPGMAPVAGPETEEKPPADGESVEDKPEASPEASQTSPDESGGEGPDTKPPEDSETPGDDQGLLVLIALVKGSTYRFRGVVYKKGEPTAVESEIAERLVNSGFFERSTIHTERG